MRIPFVKMHGLGNDFVVIDARDLTIDTWSALAIRWCDRHFGVGGDGLLLWTGSVQAPRMTVINADGSIPEMCGNGLRCFAKFIGDRFRRTDDVLVIDTGAGPLQCTLTRGADGLVEQVAVEMGRATWQPAQVPVQVEEPLLCAQVEVAGTVLHLSALSVGNPHAVTFDALDRAEQLRLGPILSTHALFPRHANIEFARIVARDGQPAIEVDVYERGCAWTLACGTGATATAFEAARQGLVPRDVEVPVKLPGGWLGLTIRSDGTARMRGPAAEVFVGDVVV